jgi:hypothetical protein
MKFENRTKFGGGVTFLEGGGKEAFHKNGPLLDLGDFGDFVNEARILF